MKKYCKFCNEEIHPLRLEILPNTTTCVKCSQERPKIGRFMTSVDGDDVEASLEIFDRDTYEKIVKLENSYSKGSKDDGEGKVTD